MNIALTLHQPNDITIKYGFMALNKRAHEYFDLEGNYVQSYPTEVITKDMRNLRMDICYKTDREELNNIEEQSTIVRIKDLKRFADYKSFCEYQYRLPVRTIIIITVDEEKCEKCYEITDTNFLKPKYITLKKENLIKKYKNLKNKIKNNEELTEKESLDIAFIPLFASKEKASWITEEMCILLSKEKTMEYELRKDISFILQIMIFKNIDDYEKREKLLERINMKQFESDLEVIAYDIYGDQLETQEEIIKQKNREMKEKDKEMKEKDKEMKEKDKEMKEKDKEMKEKDKEMKEILLDIKQKNNLDKKQLNRINQLLLKL